MIRIEVKGIEYVVAKIKVKPGLAMKQLTSAINMGCTKIMEETRTLISTTGAPDGVPRRVSGELLKSIKLGSLKKEGTKISRTVGANPDGGEEGYASWQEFGTSRMKPRPYLSVVVEKERENIIKQMEKATQQIC